MQIAAAGDRHAARSGRLRAGLHRPAPGRPGRGVRLPGRACSSRSCTSCARPRPDRAEVAAAAAALRQAESPLLVAGGGVHYSLAEAELAAFAERHGIPVVETVAGKSSVTWDHPMLRRPDRCHRMRGRQPARRRGRRRRRRRDSTAGLHDWVVDRVRPPRAAHRRASTRPASTPASTSPLRWSATRVESLVELGAALGDWRAPTAWTARVADEVAGYWAYVDGLARRDG